MKRLTVVAALALLVAPAAAQVLREAPRDRGAGDMRGVPPARLGYGADNDAQPGGVPGNAPFNNQLRKHTDPLGANGGR